MNKGLRFRLYRTFLFALIITILCSVSLVPEFHVKAASIIYVDDGWSSVVPGADPDDAGPAVNFGTDSFATIQAAVIAAQPGDTVQVLAGTYVEQVSVNKDIFLTTTEGAVIQAFPLMNSDCTSPLLTDNHPIVCIKDTNNAVLTGFTIDGLSLGDLDPVDGTNTNKRLIGVAMRNAGGTLENNIIQNIRFDTILRSGDEGVGIYLYNSDVIARTVNILGNTITNFNKNGITVTTHGAWDLITYTISGNTISGIPNSTVAQNGIQVYVPKGIGVVESNTISNIAYNNASNDIPLVAASILNMYSPVITRNNTITGAQLGVYYLDGSGQLLANEIQVIRPGTSGRNIYGILIGDRDKDTISPIDPPVGGMSLNEVSLDELISVKVEQNMVRYFGSLPNTNTYGIEVDAGYGPNSLEITIHHNRFGEPGKGFDKGLVIHQCDPSVEEACDVGAFSYIRAYSNNILSNNTGLFLDGPVPAAALKTFIYNRIVGNLVGAENNSPIEFLVKNNWWGCNAGPNQTGCDTTLNSGTGTLANIPWLVLTTSVDQNLVVPGGVATMTASLQYNSNGVIPFTDNVPSTTPVGFSVKTLGSVLPTDGFYINGISETTFLAPFTPGDYEVCATTDNQETCSTVSVAGPLDLTDLTLLQSTDALTWAPASGSLASGFNVGLNPATEWYYLNVTDIVVNRPLVDGMHPFYLTSYPDGYLDYWAAKGVDGTPPYAEPWMPVMLEIINGNQPIFYLRVNGEPPMLVDGLQFIASGGTMINPLRINGNYFPGSYTFSGEVTDSLGLKDTVSVDVTFVTLDNWVFLPLIFK